MFTPRRRSGSVPAAGNRLSPGLRHALLLGAIALVLGTALHLAPRSSVAEAAPSQPIPSSPVASEPALQTAAGVRLGAGHLAALTLLMAGGALALYLRRGARTEEAAVLLQPLGSLKIAPNGQLRLVACGGDVLLLSVTASGITLLKSYTREAFEGLQAASEAAPTSGRTSPTPDAPKSDFAHVLRQRAVRAAMPLRSASKPAETAPSGLPC